MFGSNPNPAVSASVLRKVSKSKFSRISGLSRALKSRLYAFAYSELATIAQQEVDEGMEEYHTSGMVRSLKDCWV
jgi:hypothetical protein